MAVRPPSSGSSEPESIEFGIAALNARLDEADVSFPATTDDILDELGGAEIPYDTSGHSIDLADALDRLPAEEFENETELLRQLHPVFETERAKGGAGFIGRLRELLPF